MYEQMIYDMNDFADLADKIATFKTLQADTKELQHGYYENVYDYIAELTIEELQEMVEDLGIPNVL